MQQQLGLPNAPLCVRRIWCTPGGRLAAHVALPTPLAAQVLARKRYRLRGTAVSVDLLRDRLRLELWKVGREQLGQQGAPCDGPAAGPQQVESPVASVLTAAVGLPDCFRPSPLLLVSCIVFCVFFVWLSIRMHLFPP
jgi:hypothetical protein